MNDNINPGFSPKENPRDDTFDTDTLPLANEEKHQEVSASGYQLSLVDIPQEHSAIIKNEMPASKQAQTYIAHYTSPTNSSPAKGFFEYESKYRASSKDNYRDARIKMLDIYGEKAVSWVIDELKLKRENERLCGDQLELDFRKPPRKRRRRQTS